MAMQIAGTTLQELKGRTSDECERIAPAVSWLNIRVAWV